LETHHNIDCSVDPMCDAEGAVPFLIGVQSRSTGEGAVTISQATMTSWINSNCQLDRRPAPDGKGIRKRGYWSLTALDPKLFGGAKLKPSIATATCLADSDCQSDSSRPCVTAHLHTGISCIDQTCKCILVDKTVCGLTTPEGGRLPQGPHPQDHLNDQLREGQDDTGFFNVWV